MIEFKANTNFMVPGLGTFLQGSIYSVPVSYAIGLERFVTFIEPQTEEDIVYEDDLLGEI